MTPPLHLGDDELTEWLRQRLWRTEPMSPPLDERFDEAPFEYPVRLYRIEADTRGRARIVHSIVDLLDNASRGGWPASAIDELGRLIESAAPPDAAISIRLEEIAHVSRLTGPNPEILERVAIRTLSGLGHPLSRTFWESRVRTLGAESPALVFRGLARHGIGLAFDQLPALAPDAARLGEVLPVLSFLASQEGGPATIRHAFAFVAPFLSDAVRVGLEEWMALEIPDEPPQEICTGRILPSGSILLFGTSLSSRVASAGLATA